MENKVSLWFNQLNLKISYRWNKAKVLIANSIFVENLAASIFYGVAVMLALLLFYPISIKLYLASVGIAIIVDDIMSRIDKWFINFRR